MLMNHQFIVFAFALLVRSVRKAESMPIRLTTIIQVHHRTS